MSEVGTGFSLNLEVKKISSRHCSPVPKHNDIKVRDVSRKTVALVIMIGTPSY
jgi:hypothetical protein